MTDPDLHNSGFHRPGLQCHDQQQHSQTLQRNLADTAPPAWSYVCRSQLTAFCLSAAMLLSVFPAEPFVQSRLWAAADETTDAATQLKTVERFLSVLLKNPRRGTALDRVYGHHVESGTLDMFIRELREKTVATPDDGASWMLLGLIESQRGQDAAAADAFRAAETHRKSDALASWYRAQSLLRIGRHEEAVAAFEQAISRQPQRNDLQEIFQQLGRVHQRAHRTEQAMQVWKRLETLFPGDPRVLEQIAVILAEEGQLNEALPRYEQLAVQADDDYRRTMFRIEAAELKIRTGRRDDGIADLESLLKELDPDSWICRDVRRRIDDVFLRSGDQDSLVNYYQKWLAAHPDDVEGMARLARYLSSSARVPEAKQWMEKALQQAPSRTDLRKSFIDQLVDDQRIPEAIGQYALLTAAAPGNIDFLRDWGKLVLKDRTQDPEKRNEEAVRIWNQIVAIRPDDALTVSQTADLFRQAGMKEEALALYQKSVQLAPDDPQYREYLGEFYHLQKRDDDALKTWAEIASGPLHTPENVSRLAEVYNSFGYLSQAVAEIAEACRLAPKEFALQLKSAEYHMRATKVDDALVFISAAEKLAVSDDERDAVIRQRIEAFQAADRLKEETAELESRIAADSAATAADWTLLARYFEADRRLVDAQVAIDKGLTADPDSIAALTSAARITESSGDFGKSAEYSRRLAVLDRRSRGDHIMNVARLESQLGRSDQAMAAASELISSAPGNTDNYEFFAQLCFQLGKPNEGLEALRKAVRINPGEPRLILATGKALAEQLRTDEAIEVFWRAFEKSETIEDRVSLIQTLVPLHEQLNQLDKLIERLDRDRREDGKRREMTICLAQAYQTSGDLGSARAELEQLLSQDTRDTSLLQQLAKLCESSGDLEAAIAYQRQLIAVAPGHETEFPLTRMLQARGDRDEAMEILIRLTAREDDPVRLLRSIDSLMAQEAWEAVISVTEPLLSQQRDDWELLYREGVAWARLEKHAEATLRFRRILGVTLPHDTYGLYAAEDFKKQQAKARSENLRGIQTEGPQKQSPLHLLNYAGAVQAATGLRTYGDSVYAGRQGSARIWTPREFGTARMASFGWQLYFEQQAEQTSGQTSVAAEVESKATADGASREAVYDWLYVLKLNDRMDAIFPVAAGLARTGGKEEQQFFVTASQSRHLNSGVAGGRRGNPGSETKSPLSNEDLELLLKCYHNLTRDTDRNAASTAFGGNMIYDPQGNAYVQVGGSYVRVGIAGKGQFVLQIYEELKLAGREDEAEANLKEVLDSARTAAETSQALSVLLHLQRDTMVADLYERWLLAAKEELARPLPAASGSRSGISSGRQSGPLQQIQQSLLQWIGRLAPEEEHVQILSILDSALDVAAVDVRRKLSDRSTRIRRPSQSTSRRSPFGLQWIYGEKSEYIQIDFPMPGTCLDSSVITLLRQVHEVFRRNDVLPDLAARMRQRVTVSSADTPSSADDVIFNQLCLAAVLWWADEKDESLSIMTAVSDKQKDDPESLFELAELRTQNGDFDDALTLIDSFVPRDQQLLQRRELQAMNLAERLGDHERARSAAERLFGLRLDSAAQLSLVDGMRRLSMNDMADAVVARTERQSGNQPAALATLMTLYQGQGKTDKARQLAHVLLRRTVSPISSASASGNPPGRGQSVEDGLRSQALQVLLQTGELKKLITQLEAQCERSPDSPRFIEQLIEFYGVTEQKDKIEPLLLRSVTTQPDAFGLRFMLAKHFEQTGKFKESSDHYLELLRGRPDWIMQDFYRAQNVFQRAGRTEELIRAVSAVNLKSSGQPWNIVNLVQNLIQDEKNSELAVALLEKVVETLPGHSRHLISSIRRPEHWKNDRIYRLAKKLIIPSLADIRDRPWAGVDQIDSYSANGEVTAPFHLLIHGIDGTDKLADFRQSIEATLETSPSWYGGRAMLALIEIQQQNGAVGKKQLESLVSDEAAMKSIPSDSCWLLGRELDTDQDTRALAVRLFEKGMETSTQSTRQLQYSPATSLIRHYVESGRPNVARDLLLRQLRSSTYTQYDAQYNAYLKTENMTFAAAELLNLNFPVDAFRIYRDLLSNEEQLRMASQMRGSTPDQVVTQVKAGLARAMKALNNAVADNSDVPETNSDASFSDETVKQLLATSDIADGSTARLDLMISIPSTASPGKVPMESSLVTLLIAPGKKASVTEGIGSQLNALQQEYPSDISITVAAATMHSSRKSPAFADSLNRLIEITDRQPLDAIEPGRRPNSRQRRMALQFVPLWIVAREGLKIPDLRQQSETLAERALQGADRQMGFLYSSAILLEWSQLLLDAGQKADAEAKLERLLTISCERPKRRTQTAESKQAETVPPLTISQFRVAMTVAQAAAANGMASLSRRAVREAMLGGSPVPDPSTALTTNPRQVRRIGGQSEPAPAARFDAEVVESLQGVISQWSGDGYSANEVYETLKPLIFPQGRPDDIMLYPDHTQLRNARATSLGLTITEWALKSGRIDDLKNETISRQTKPQSAVPALVLLTQCAIAANEDAAALATLNQLSELLKKTPSEAMVQLACHAAIPASDRKELEVPAYDILKLALQGPWKQLPQPGQFQGDNPVNTATGKLDQMVHQYLAKSGRLDEIRGFLEAQEIARRSRYAQYGGDYGTYLQWKDLAGFAADAARSQIPKIAMEYLGRTTDFQAERYSPPDTSMPLATVVRYLSTQDHRARYEAWRDWTMPTKDRRTIRVIAQFVEPVHAPEPFLQISPRPGKVHRSDLLCNLTEMLSAASECGALDELHEQVMQVSEEKLPNAEFLRALWLIEKGDTAAGIPAVNQLLDSMQERYQTDGNQQPRPPLADYAVFRRCLQSPGFSEIFSAGGRTRLRMMVETLRSMNVMCRLDVDFLELLSSRTGSQLQPGLQSVPPLWLAASSIVPYSTTSAEFSNNIAPWWITQDNMLFHLAGTGLDVLYMTYPLEGNFEFSVECLQRNWGECDAGYGGVIVRSQEFGSTTTILSNTGEDLIRRPGGLKRTAPSWNQVAVQSVDGTVRYLLNGQLVYEEKLTGTSPWVTLSTSYNRVATFRNPRLTGTPVIPREVRLIGEASMEGWSCAGFGDRQPSPRLMAEKPGKNDGISYEQRDQPAVFDWSVKEGVLTGQAVPAADIDRQSRIRYCRPLHVGDTLKYEFFYEPGKCVAHPSIGRLAIMLEPEGVITHWIAKPGWDDTFSGIPLDNSVSEAAYRRGPAALPLKPGEWNQVEMQLNDGMAAVSLNGSLVFERPVSPNSDTRFGFFRYQRQTSRIQNVLLTGQWPDTVSADAATNLLTGAQQLSVADQKLLNELIPEHVFEVQVPELLAQAAALSDQEAFDLLKTWVMPPEGQSLIRLACRARWYDPRSDEIPSATTDIQSPALELVRIAKRLNRTDELLKQVSALPAEDELSKRNQQAMLALLRLQGSDVEQMHHAILDVKATLEKGLSPLLTPQQRSAELLVACEAAQHPESRALAAELAAILCRMERDEKLRSRNDRFQRNVTGVLGPLISESDAAQPDASALGTAPAPGTAQWQAVRVMTPKHRAFGQRAALWKLSAGRAHHRPGAAETLMFFQSPLRGQFEVRARRVPSSGPLAEDVLLSWGMHAAMPRRDLTGIRLMKNVTDLQIIDRKLEIPGWNESAELRLSVKDSTVTTFVNGVKIYDHTLPVVPSPWLVLQTSNPGDDAAIADVRIIGNPEIPEQLDLIEMSEWTCWRTDIHAEQLSTGEASENVQPAWKKSGDEIIGQQQTTPAATPVETVAQYLRPMLEDGVIEFDWFLIPGEQEVYPSLGRTAFLIHSDGVTIHSLTEAQYETSALRTDNESPLAAAAPPEGASPKVELRTNDWNTVRLTLKDDQLTINVNGSNIGVHTVTERASDRFFGLFRYAAKTGCRVRRLVYRGNWPGTLPSIENQDLAGVKP